MIPVQRYARILEHLRERVAASIHELAEDIGVSASTIRRDLEHLAAQGYVDRTRGGAVMPRDHMATFEMEPTIAAEIAREQKTAIGRAAAQMLEAGQSVIFDSSSTVMEAARAAIARGIALTVVTNDLAIAQSFAATRNSNVVVPGGTLRVGSSTLVGEPGVEFLGRLHADVALLGTHTISGRQLTETSLEVAAAKRSMIRAASRVVVLADGSKFRERAFCTICDVSEVDEVVTDAGADAAAVESLVELGLKVTRVPVDRA
ncbi:MAG: DeoR/GlpR family DNA-binding transcription regulator [Burkholderiaceae bacterium]|nr:DeoR/GlpR family DNA-binding transcription regulator [Burkholderiaceae bacterium]